MNKQRCGLTRKGHENEIFVHKIFALRQPIIFELYFKCNRPDSASGKTFVSGA